MSTVWKRIISVLLVLFMVAASLAVMPPVSASALSQIKYSVSYSGKNVYLKLTPKNSSDKIYYTADGTSPTKKSSLYKKKLGASSMTFIRAVEYNKSGKKVAVLNIVIKPRVQRPKSSVTMSGKTLYVKLTSATSGAKIYYTTDGSKPTKKSKLYTGAIKCKEGTVIRARAYKNKMNASKITKIVVKKPEAKPVEIADNKPDEADNNDTQKPADTPTVSDDTPVQPEKPSEPAETDIEGVFRIMNEERAKAGVSKLTLDSGLCSVAALRARELETEFSHYRPNGTMCFTALEEYGIIRLAEAENIAMGQVTAAEVMKDWMNSPGHRGNILSASYSNVGIGCYVSNGVKYWVQLFTN